ncbi:hypothetical protein DXG01_012752 [Tephrocybe rancida]|nr:hypothetical protein DXG01_012752 [Tephrocybe rancida]
MAVLNMHAMRMGPGKHLQGRTLMNGLVKPEEFDYFHEVRNPKHLHTNCSLRSISPQLIITQEFARSSLRGYGDGLLGGKVIGLPPVLNFGSEELKAKIVPEVLSGKKFICLAISEAHAGSDVMGLQTSAVKSEDGKEWIINGLSLYRTQVLLRLIQDLYQEARNGLLMEPSKLTYAQDGFTVILVERGPGVETKQIKTSYSTTAGTAYITFDDVRVPVGNTLGEEGGGIFVMLSNFNHERWVMCCASARSQRGIIEECLKWTTQRKVFGKPLHSQASYRQQASKLAGQIAFLKSYSTACGQETARDAVQIFGGRGITATGMGQYIEHYHRTIPFDALLGGAEDVLADLGVRQALRAMPQNARL